MKLLNNYNNTITPTYERNGKYLLDRFGIIHRIVYEKDKNNNKHMQYSNSIIIEEHQNVYKCVTEGVGSTFYNSNPHNNIKTVIKMILSENFHKKYEFYKLIDNKIVEFVEWKPSDKLK